MRIVDLSGFMFSGKAAVSDLLSEFSSVYVPNYRREFDLLRVGGGLIDLKDAVENWSPIRTYAALERFKKVIERLSRSVSFSESFLNIGWGYEKEYPELSHALKEFFDEIIELEWDTPWPYAELETDALDLLNDKLNGFKGSRRLYARVAANILHFLSARVIHKQYIGNKGSVQDVRKYQLVSKEKFLPAAEVFCKRLICGSSTPSSYHIAVTHNALEPFDPARNADILGADSKCIVVDRDPRDIYATSISFQTGFNDNVAFYKTIAGADSVDTFVKRYKIYRSQIVDNKRVLRLDFSDLVLSYEPTLDRICEFLQLDRKDHRDKFSKFNPEKSIENLDMWRSDKFRSFQQQFAFIENETK